MSKERNEIIEQAAVTAWHALAEYCKRHVLNPHNESELFEVCDKIRALKTTLKICSHHNQPGGCRLHDIHCGYPKCNEDAEPKKLTLEQRVEAIENKLNLMYK